jgi:hypothetical protein
MSLATPHHSANDFILACGLTILGLPILLAFLGGTLLLIFGNRLPVPASRGLRLLVLLLFAISVAGPALMLIVLVWALVTPVRQGVIPPALFYLFGCFYLFPATAGAWFWFKLARGLLVKRRSTVPFHQNGHGR